MDNPMHFECNRESARVIPGTLAMSVLLISLTPIMAAPAKSSASSQDEPAYRSNSNLVLLDVVVRDKLGRPVAGLKQSDFEDQDRGAAGHAEAKNKRESRFRLEYSIDPLRIQLLPAPRGARKAELEIAQSAYALDGRRVASTDLGLAVLLSPQEMAEVAKDDIRVLQEIRAPESACFLRLAVRDATSGRIRPLEIALPNSSAKP